MNKNKPKWDKPQLIVLVRGRPEEGVLRFCKGTKIIGPRKHGTRTCRYVTGTSCRWDSKS